MAKEQLVVSLEARAEMFLGSGALNLDGLVAAMTVPGSINTEVFLTYVTQVLAPQLWKGAIVVMDNLKVHHAERVRVAIESVGALIQVSDFSR